MSPTWSDGLRQKHMRAICEEIGERLRPTLDRTALDPPARLVALLRGFEQMEQTEAPQLHRVSKNLGKWALCCRDGARRRAC